MQIFIGSDYRGFEKKNQLKDFLNSMGLQVVDMGPHEYHEGDDYNDAAVAVSKSVRENIGSFGILICGSAHGMTIQANRFKGIRATYCSTIWSATIAREHEDANILCLSAESATYEEMKTITLTFIDTIFKPIERRVRRINRLDEREDYA